MPGCPCRDREKHEATTISSGTTNGFSNPCSPLVNERHRGTNVVYPDVNKGIKTPVAPMDNTPHAWRASPTTMLC